MKPPSTVEARVAEELRNWLSSELEQLDAPNTNQFAHHVVTILLHEDLDMEDEPLSTGDDFLQDIYSIRRGKTRDTQRKAAVQFLRSAVCCNEPVEADIQVVVDELMVRIEETKNKMSSKLSPKRAPVNSFNQSRIKSDSNYKDRFRLYNEAFPSLCSSGKSAGNSQELEVHVRETSLDMARSRQQVESARQPEPMFCSQEEAYACLTAIKVFLSAFPEAAFPSFDATEILSIEEMASSVSDSFSQAYSCWSIQSAFQACTLLKKFVPNMSPLKPVSQSDPGSISLRQFSPTVIPVIKQSHLHLDPSYEKTLTEHPQLFRPIKAKQIFYSSPWSDTDLEVDRILNCKQQKQRHIQTVSDKHGQVSRCDCASRHCQTCTLSAGSRHRQMCTLSAGSRHRQMCTLSAGSRHRQMCTLSAGSRYPQEQLSAGSRYPQEQLLQNDDDELLESIFGCILEGDTGDNKDIEIDIFDMGQDTSVVTCRGMYLDKKVGSPGDVCSDKKVGSAGDVCSDKKVDSPGDVCSDKKVGSAGDECSDKKVGSAGDECSDKKVGSAGDECSDKKVGSAGDECSDKKVGSAGDECSDKKVGTVGGTSLLIPMQKDCVRQCSLEKSADGKCPPKLNLCEDTCTSEFDEICSFPHLPCGLWKHLADTGTLNLYPVVSSQMLLEEQCHLGGSMSPCEDHHRSAAINARSSSGYVSSMHDARGTKTGVDHCFCQGDWTQQWQLERARIQVQYYYALRQVSSAQEEHDCYLHQVGVHNPFMPSLLSSCLSHEDSQFLQRAFVNSYFSDLLDGPAPSIQTRVMSAVRCSDLEHGWLSADRWQIGGLRQAHEKLVPGCTCSSWLENNCHLGELCPFSHPRV